MRSSVFIIGIILVLLGIFAYYYGGAEAADNGETVYSFRPYSYPLVIGGLVLVILAFIIPTKEEMNQNIP